MLILLIKQRAVFARGPPQVRQATTVSFERANQRAIANALARPEKPSL